MALAWLLHKGDDIVPIPGTKRRRYLEENVGGASLALEPADLEALDRALAARGGGGAEIQRTHDDVHRSIGATDENRHHRRGTTSAARWRAGFTALGHDVSIANSRGPETLADAGQGDRREGR